MGKLLLVACTNVGRYIIEELMTNPDTGAELAGVVNLNPQQALNKANYDSYSDLVAKYHFPIFYCDNINDADCVAFMRQVAPDVILQSGWSQKFHDEVLNLPKYGCIGEHPAPLPRGRGAACVNWAILTGETDWGDSYFQMVSEYDKGCLYAQRFFRIEKYDTVFTVYEKVARCAAEVVATYAGKWTRGEFDVVEQDESKVTYYKRRRPTDGEITDFAQNANVLHNFIRAQTHPYPGAYITTGEGKLTLLSSDAYDNQPCPHATGTVFAATAHGGVLLAAAEDTVLEVIRVQEEGAPSRWAAELVDGKTLPVNIFDILKK